MRSPQPYLTVASILSGFSISVFMFRIQRELSVRDRHPEWPNWLAWADYLDKNYEDAGRRLTELANKHPEFEMPAREIAEKLQKSQDSLPDKDLFFEFNTGVGAPGQN